LDARPGLGSSPIQSLFDVPYVSIANERAVANLLPRQQFFGRNSLRKSAKYKDISKKSLCACSALPYIEDTVTIDNEVYCEGALIDTVNFSQLIEDHRDLDEIWVSRIVDVKQVRAPENIKDALGNLCMLFAGSLGDDDVKLFKYHARDEGWKGIIYEIRVPTNINFDWTRMAVGSALPR
jgi:hypothetical protein